MRKFLLIFIVCLISIVSFSEFRELVFRSDEKTGLDIPQVFTFSELLDKFGEDFDANWYSLRIKDVNDKDIVYQITDMDSNDRISSDDLISFCFKGEARLVVSDDFDMDILHFDSNFEVLNDDDSYIVNNKNFSFKISNKGLISFISFDGNEGNIFNEIGTARVAGWSGSSYYIDGKLGKHVENTSNGFSVKSLKVSDPGAVSISVKSVLTYDDLPGFNQEIVSTVFYTGDVVVNNKFYFTNYVDLMKLQVMATNPLLSMDDSSLHILPVFRRLVWAEQLGIRSVDYWKQRDSIKFFNDIPYIAFNAGEANSPLWWGASYLFGSMENFRANYSDKLNIATVEILPTKPVIYSDFKKFILGSSWMYESREFRDGFFRWMPDEFNLYEPTKGVFNGTSDQEIGDNLMMKFKAGDIVEFDRIYSVYGTKNVKNIFEFLNNRSLEIQSVTIK
jgi:hypothetical protein